MFDLDRPDSGKKVEELVRLAPRRVSWLPGSVGTFAIGLIGSGIFWLCGLGLLAGGIVLFVCGVIAMIVVFGKRSDSRAALLDVAIESIQPILGVSRPTRETVQARGWEGSWVGFPRKVRIRYAATADDAEKAFSDEIVSRVSRRLGVAYELDKLRPTKCIIDLRRSVLQAESREIVLRAEKTVRDLFGSAIGFSATMTEDNELCAVDVEHNIGARIAMPAVRQRIEKVFNTMVEGRWRSRWDLHSDTVRFELRPLMPEMIMIKPNKRVVLTHDVYKKFQIELGRDEDGRSQYWTPYIDSHMLIVGATNSGKTAAEHNILVRLAEASWRIWVLDGKRIEFLGFGDYPNVELIAQNIGEQVAMIHAAHNLMEERYDLLQQRQARIEDFEPLALIIDEYATFKDRVTAWYPSVKVKGDPAKPPVFALMADLGRLARKAKIHMALGLQRPDAEFLGGEMRDNFRGRMSLGRMSPVGSNMMWESYSIGAAITSNVKGRGIVNDQFGNPVEIQTVYVPDPDTFSKTDTEKWELVESLHPDEVSYPPMMIQPPEMQVDDNSDLVSEPDYHAWAMASIVPFQRKLQADVRREPRALPQFEETSQVDTEILEHEDDFYEGYTDPDVLRVGDVGEGDLVLIDESLDLWGIVQQVVDDALNEGSQAIDFVEVESGDEGTTSIQDGTPLTVRRPAKI